MFMQLIGHGIREAHPPLMVQGDDLITWVDAHHMGYSTFDETTNVIDSWADMSPRRYLYAQTDAAEKPTLERTSWGNGTGQVDFDGNDELFDSVTSEGDTLDPGFTFISALNPDSTSVADIVMLGASQASGELRFKQSDGASNAWMLVVGGELSSGVAPTTGEQIVTCNERDNRTGFNDPHWFIDGANIATSGNVSSSVPYADDAYIPDHPTNEREFAGKIKTMLLISTAFGGTTTPPTDESVRVQRAIEQYIADRAGITLLAV